MQRKELQHIKLKQPELGNRQKEGENNTFETPEAIDLQPSYSKADIQDLQHLNSGNSTLFTRPIQYNVC